MAKTKKDLIKVKKGNEIIEISPLVLANHQQLGWVVVEEKGKPAEEPAGGKSEATAKAEK